MSYPPKTPLDPNAPYSQESEVAVLGAILLDPSTFISLSAFLKADDFFLLRHNYIWKAMESVIGHGDPIDPITLAEELENRGILEEIGGRAYLVQLVNDTPTSLYAEVYGRLVERTSIRRKLMAAADDIKKLATDETLNIDSVVSQVETTLFNVTEKQVRREFIPMWDAISAYYDRMEHMLLNRNEVVGLPSGFRDMDALLGGFQKSDLLIFAGRPGMGKCLIGNTIIYVNNQLTKLEALKPNLSGMPDDEGGIYYPLEIEVLTPDGIRKTSHFYEAGEKPTLCLTTQSEQTLTGTWNHAVLSLRNGDKAWVALADLAIGDAVAILELESASAKKPAKPSQQGETVLVLTADELLPVGYVWDEIVSIEDAGIQACYDLVVPESHSYIANGIVSHNTSWMLTAAINTARFGARVAIFTMEMGVEQLIQRMVSMETGINVQKLRLGKLTQQEIARFTEAVGRISNFKIFIDDSPAMSPMEMRTKCRRLKHEYGLDLVIVDYLQLMNSGGNYENNRVQEISYISRALKELARELNVPLISAAQLSRAVEQRQDKRPVLSDLRESGSIEQDSDIVMFLYRDEVYNEATEFPNQADIIVAKHRNGPTGTVSLYFEKSLTKFMDASVHRVDLSDLE